MPASKIDAFIVVVRRHDCPSNLGRLGYVEHIFVFQDFYFAIIPELEETVKYLDDNCFWEI